MDYHANVAALNHLAGVAEKPETGDIGAGMNTCLLHQFGRFSIECGHTLHDFGFRTGTRYTAFYCGADNARAQRLGQNQFVANLGTGIEDHFCRVDDAGNGKPVLQFGVLNRVSAHHNGTRLVHFFQAAGQYLFQDGYVHGLYREADDIHGGKRSAAHGIYVAQRIGRRHLPE